MVTGTSSQISMLTVDHLGELREKLLDSHVKQDVRHLWRQTAMSPAGPSPPCPPLTCLLSRGCCKPSNSKRMPSWLASSPIHLTSTSGTDGLDETFQPP